MYGDVVVVVVDVEVVVNAEVFVVVVVDVEVVVNAEVIVVVVFVDVEVVVDCCCLWILDFEVVVVDFEKSLFCLMKKGTFGCFGCRLICLMKMETILNSPFLALNVFSSTLLYIYSNSF